MLTAAVCAVIVVACLTLATKQGDTIFGCERVTKPPYYCDPKCQSQAKCRFGYDAFLGPF